MPLPHDTAIALGVEREGVNFRHCHSRSLMLDRLANPALEKDDRRDFFLSAFKKAPVCDRLVTWRSFLTGGLGLSDGDILFAQLRSRLMVNMAGGVMENAGLCLDRFGVPYIPGSAVKGCARRMAIQNLLEAREAKEPPDKIARLLVDIALVFGWGERDWMEDKDKNAHFKSDFVYAVGENQWREIFVAAGSQLLNKEPASAKDFGHFAGVVGFLPAYPHQLPANDLELDVLTCHHGKYYSEPTEPALPHTHRIWLQWKSDHDAWEKEWGTAPDTEEPNPVVFPAVGPGKQTEQDRCIFAFAVLPLRGERDSFSRPGLKLHQLGRGWLRDSLATFGLGAKTAAGYGWFEGSDDFNAGFRKSLTAAERKPDVALLAEFSVWDDKQVRKAARAYAYDALWPKQGREASEDYQFTLASFCLDQKKALFLAEKNHAGSDFAKGVKKLAAKFNIALP